MTVSGNISVPSAIHDQLTLSVTGTSTLNYATAFANVLNTANSNGSLLITDLDTPLPAPGPSSGETVEYTVLSAGETGTIPSGGAYLLDAADGSTTVTGSGAGDTAMAASLAGSGGMTYLDQGGDNNILFVSGNNSYIGPSQGITPESDTITAGSGNDSISTGTGFATVFSGTGHADITLRDIGLGAAAGQAYDDTVVLNDGVNTVNAMGAADLIDASAPGQVINGGGNAADSDLIVIDGNVPGSGGSDMLYANAANFSVNDSAGGNTITGGSGVLTLVANPADTGTTLRDTIKAANGAADLFGNAGSIFTLLATGSSQQDLFVAGTGNETFDGSGASGNLLVFGNDAGNLVFAAGTGLAQYVEGQAQTDSTVYSTIEGGAGKLEIFGGSGNDLVLTEQAGGGVVYVAGADSETIQASAVAKPMTVFGGAGGNLAIQSGTGNLLFVGGTSFAETPAATITAGSGGAVMFGNDGDVLTLSSTAANTSVFVAGAGNETLDAATFNGVLVNYAYNPADPIDGGNVNESITGGTGPNYFYTGAGYETFVAGTGANAFQIDKTVDGLGGTITIYNYAAGDVISFGGFTSAEETAAIKSATPATDGITGTQITLSDQTTVLFVDASAGALTFKT